MGRAEVGQSSVRGGVSAVATNAETAVWGTRTRAGLFPRYGTNFEKTKKGRNLFMWHLFDTMILLDTSFSIQYPIQVQCSNCRVWQACQKFDQADQFNICLWYHWAELKFGVCEFKETEVQSSNLAEPPKLQAPLASSNSESNVYYFK